MTIDDLRTKRIGVLGWGVNHQAVTRWLLHHGATQISVLDEASDCARDAALDVNWQIGPQAFDELDQFDLLLRSPGIPLDHPKVAAARAAGVEISSQTNLFFSLTPARMIGVTGTNGKGTTAALIYAMLEAEWQARGERQPQQGRSYLAGNIGRDPFEFLDQLTPDDWVVLELSSFQLEDLRQSPHIAVVLTITPDHLNHHRSIKDYQAAKRTIVSHQSKTDHAVLHQDDPVSASFASATTAAIHWYSTRQRVADGVDIATVAGNEEFEMALAGHRRSILETTAIKLPGQHNWQNVAAAMAAASLAGVGDLAIARAAKAFSGLPHRLETVATINGVRYVNDSIATSPIAAEAALQSFNQPIVLILGGQGKGSDYSTLIPAVGRANIRAVVCYGDEGEQFRQLLTAENMDRQILYERSFDAAFESAALTAKPGDIVLLSPAATGYDQFRTYAQRGNRFRQLVAEMTHVA